MPLANPKLIVWTLKGSIYNQVMLFCYFFHQVPLFPVFTRSGEVTVSIDLVREGVTFTQSEMRRFEGFHKFVFSRVLRLDKDPMLFLPTDAPYSCLVVPVLTGKTKILPVLFWL